MSLQDLQPNDMGLTMVRKTVFLLSMEGTEDVMGKKCST